jgi:hypothetical protein
MIMSILDFPPLDLGKVLRPLDRDDDLLGEMLDEKAIHGYPPPI